jgi:hypothetical protein
VYTLWGEKGDNGDIIGDMRIAIGYELSPSFLLIPKA